MIKSNPINNQEVEFFPFSIWQKAYESELDKKYNIILSQLKNGRKSNISKSRLEKNVSFTRGSVSKKTKINRKIIKKYESLSGNCSMIIDDIEELQKHIEKIYEISYNHYVFGKESNMKGYFPELCCGQSARNVALILMEKGYPNSTFFYNKKWDHCYVGLPFILNEKKGFIIIDPTSEQLFDNKETAPRNNLFVVEGIKWKYETDWENGKNLYPSKEDSSQYSNLYTIKKQKQDGNQLLEKFENINEYYEKIFENPIKVNPDDIIIY